MFVRKSKYDELKRDYAISVGRHNAAAVELHNLKLRWNSVVDRLNDLQTRVNTGQLVAPGVAHSQFSPQEIERLIRLCHPDKHDSSTAANEMTARLLSLRKKTR